MGHASFQASVKFNRFPPLGSETRDFVYVVYEPWLSCVLWFRFIFAFCINCPYPIISNSKTFWESNYLPIATYNCDTRFIGRVWKIAKKGLLAPSCLSVCPSVRMEQLGRHWTDFHEVWYFSIFRKSVGKIQVWLKYDKNNGYFAWRSMHISDHISLNSS